jgi:hypothetical protein
VLDVEEKKKDEAKIRENMRTRRRRIIRGGAYVYEVGKDGEETEER